MTDESTRSSAPNPIGDVVPGEPPVPITVWHVRAPQPGQTRSAGLGVRLVHNFTYPGDLIIDLTHGPQLARAIIASGRRSPIDRPVTLASGNEPAALIVTPARTYRRAHPAPLTRGVQAGCRWLSGCR